MTIDRPHLVLAPTGQRVNFATRQQARGRADPPFVANRRATSGRIVREVVQLVQEVRNSGDEVLDPSRIPMTVRATKNYGVVASIPGRRNELLSAVGHHGKARLNVAFDESTVENFEKAGEKYVEFNPAKSRRRPNHFNFFEAEPEIAMTTLADLWASHLPVPDDGDLVLEVWLQPAAEPRFREVIEMLELQQPKRGLSFEEVRALRMESTREDFEHLARSAAIAQLRPASTLSGHIFQVPSGVQVAAVEAAARRLTHALDTAPAVCILDTGVRRSHPLLTKSLAFAGTVVGGTADDWDGHGTKMAGLALFEDIGGLVVGRQATTLGIRLESVKIESAPGAGGAARLPADRLRMAVDLVEAESDRPRTFCLAMNAPEDSNDGGASTLASEIDVLAADVASPRLFCVAAGNLEDPLVLTDYQSMNDVTGMMAPAQAWNALTVAACTDLDAVPASHGPVAPAGDLSPWSTTGVNWERSNRPASKPDIVFEGGNTMYDLASNDVGPHADLCLLTTSMDPTAPLTLTGQTSAATAAVSGLCARLQAEYPMLWPETVRGLVVHSSEHTAAMTARVANARGPGGVQRALLQRFGYGRPDRARAMANAEDALTLINQASLRPFRLNDNEDNVVLGQMRFHSMPWPADVLEQLVEVEAELRVTLSYFVDPNPGAVIRGETRAYASHGFDFDVKRPDESEEDAIARINKLYDTPMVGTPPQNWRFGQYRGRGGVKHDRLKLDSAADLARMGGIMVYPQQGWRGQDQDMVDLQARYSLIVTIRTPEQEIYTEISNAILV